LARRVGAGAAGEPTVWHTYIVRNITFRREANQDGRACLGRACSSFARDVRYGPGPLLHRSASRGVRPATWATLSIRQRIRSSCRGGIVRRRRGCRSRPCLSNTASSIGPCITRYSSPAVGLIPAAHSDIETSSSRGAGYGGICDDRLTGDGRAAGASGGMRFAFPPYGGGGIGSVHTAGGSPPMMVVGAICTSRFSSFTR